MDRPFGEGGGQARGGGTLGDQQAMYIAECHRVLGGLCRKEKSSLGRAYLKSNGGRRAAREALPHPNLQRHLLEAVGALDEVRWASLHPRVFGGVFALGKKWGKLLFSPCSVQAENKSFAPRVSRSVSVVSGSFAFASPAGAVLAHHPQNPRLRPQLFRSTASSVCGVLAGLRLGAKPWSCPSKSFSIQTGCPRTSP